MDYHPSMMRRMKWIIPALFLSALLGGGCDDSPAEADTKAAADELAAIERTKAASQPTAAEQPLPVVEDRIATNEEIRALLEIRKKLGALQALRSERQAIDSAYKSSLNLLNADFIREGLFEKFSTGTLKDKQLPRAVKDVIDEYYRKVQIINDALKAMADLGFSLAAIPDRARVEWDLMTGTPRRSDYLRYQLVQSHLEKVAAELIVTEADRNRLEATLKRVENEGVTRFASVNCYHCKKANYFHPNDRQQRVIFPCWWCGQSTEYTGLIMHR